MKIVAIIPAHNEGASVAEVVKEVTNAIPHCDVLVVDDGSTDNTVTEATLAGARVLSLAHNLGIGGAVQAGYRWASRHDYDYILRLDADGQHDAAQAERLLQPLLAGEADIAIGSRFVADLADQHRPPPFRMLGIRIFSSLVSLLTSTTVTDATSGYRCVTRRVAAYSARHHPHDFPEVESIVHYHRAGFRIVETPVVMRDRFFGESTIGGLRSYYYAFKVLLALALLTFEKRP